jgi:hypothetical protein
VWDETTGIPLYEDEQPKKKRDKKPKIRPKRCAVCRQNVEPDGYGEWVHSNTGMYCEYDENGKITHVASR